MTTSLELEMSFGCCVLDGCEDTFFVDDAHAFGRDFHRDPHILFGNVEFLGLQVGCKGSFGMDARVGNVVSGNHMLSCNLTFLLFLCVII